MGSKKTKTREVNRPVYSSQIEGAANAQNAAYNRSQGAINDFSDRLTGISGNLLDQYEMGDPTIQSAQGYVQDLLALAPGSNPYLDEMVSQANANTQRQIQTQLGTRGGIGGSSERDILANALAEQELGLRYQDYGAQMDRQARAAAMAPSLLAGSLIPLEAGARYGEAGAMLPLRAATTNSAALGGLLGQYQEREGEQRRSGGFFGDLLMSALSSGSSYFGGQG